MKRDEAPVIIGQGGDHRALFAARVGEPAQRRPVLLAGRQASRREVDFSRRRADRRRALPNRLDHSDARGVVVRRLGGVITHAVR